MEGFFVNWFLLMGIFTIALASPGPDFVIAVRNSLSFSRLSGVYTAIGFALGVGVHVTYTLFGLATVISQSVILFSLIKYAGAAYLFYIGIQSLRSNGFKDTDSLKQKRQKTLSPLQCLWNGFLTNVLNPKATLFFLSIFSQFVTPETPMNIQALYGLTCMVMTGLWFSLVAVVLTQGSIKRAFLRATKWIDKICGVLLIGLSIKLALTKAAP